MTEASNDPRAIGRAGTRRWLGVLAMVGVAVLGLSGCGGDSSDDAAGGLALEWVFTPSPATAVASADEGFDWAVPYRVTLTETGGDQGATITSITVNTYENVDREAGDEATAANTTLTDLNNRIEPRGTLALDFVTSYTLASGDKAAIIDVFLFLVDDDGFEAQIARRLEVL